MFELDEETMLPYKITTYMVDLRSKNPHWKERHEYTKHYDMSDLSPQSFDDLSDRIREDEKTANKYLRSFSIDGPLVDGIRCKEGCRKHLYCFSRSSHLHSARECMGQKLNLTEEVMQFLAGPWIEDSTKNRNYELQFE